MKTIIFLTALLVMAAQGIVLGIWQAQYLLAGACGLISLLILQQLIEACTRVKQQRQAYQRQTKEFGNLQARHDKVVRELTNIRARLFKLLRRGTRA